MTRKSVKKLAELPAAIDDLERDLKAYASYAGNELSEHVKVVLLIHVFPDSEAKLLKHRFQICQKFFDKIRSDILGYCTRFPRGSRRRQFGDQPVRPNGPLGSRLGGMDGSHAPPGRGTGPGSRRFRGR